MVNAAVPRDVPTTLSFISPTSNFNIRFIAPSAEVNTGVYEEHNVVIKDARPNRSSFTLDTGGFVLADHKSNVSDYHSLESDFTGKGNPDDLYTTEIRELLKRLTGADKVIAFGIVVRQTKPSGPNFQPPASDVHVDWTPRRAHALAKDLLSKSDEPDFKYSRFVCINLWRAISTPPQDYPLAVCDARSLTSTAATANQMIGIDKIPDMTNRDALPDGPVVSEADLFTYDENQQWYYFSDMHEGEILAFKLYDSQKDTKGGRCPHTAFLDDREGTIFRESVEIRSVVYFK